MAKTELSYNDLQKRLDEVVDKLQNEDLGVEEALQLYQQGLELIKALEDYLKTAETTVKELKAKFDKS